LIKTFPSVGFDPPRSSILGGEVPPLFVVVSVSGIDVMVVVEGVVVVEVVVEVVVVVVVVIIGGTQLQQSTSD
jgi:hypothetical protein